MMSSTVIKACPSLLPTPQKYSAAALCLTPGSLLIWKLHRDDQQYSVANIADLVAYTSDQFSTSSSILRLIKSSCNQHL